VRAYLPPSSGVNDAENAASPKRGRPFVLCMPCGRPPRRGTLRRGRRQNLKISAFSACSAVKHAHKGLDYGVFKRST